MPPGPLLASSLTVRAGGNTLLSDVSLRLHPGELCGVIGPSGAGKSTLIKVLLGLRAPAEGTVTLGGAAVGSEGAVGYVPQDDALHGTLTVRECLDFAADFRLHAAPPPSRAARVAEVARQVGLDERMDVAIRKLSGGQRKRVSVALELLHRPRLLILDEPTSGLDPGMETKMMELFREVAAGGRVVMVATHAMLNLGMCHVLLVMVGGRVAWFGPPEAALTHFEVPGYAEIFRRLPNAPPATWADLFRKKGTPERTIPMVAEERGGRLADQGDTKSIHRPPTEAKPIHRAPVADTKPIHPDRTDTKAIPRPPAASAPDVHAQLAAMKADLARKKG